ncbi:hypothetical protein [Candidatus Blastococcus massiliensis]|uniref:hypothetical protein n=1 Tax=Candidatus Blastococcus massiliensis TaxID=1470358 RepID=UPI0012DE24BF|nr:hypothetical protein [Candidatus Blastococcus massiliensis]
MTRWSLVPVALLLLSLLGIPGAAAAPAEGGTALCAFDPVRGGVPVTFPVRACVDGSAMTLHNDRSRPVVVRPLGDVGAPVRLRSENSAVAAVVRLTSGGPEVLLPGEVARWPLGAGTGFLTVGPMPVTAAPEMAGRLREVLDDVREEPAAGTLRRSVAGLVGDVQAALRAREACTEGRNFLGTTACDVAAATAIGAATAARLDRATAGEVLPALLDAEAWDEWAAVDPDWPDAPEGTLWQLPAPVPAPPVLPAPAAGTPTPAAGTDAAPAPTRTHAPAPAPAPPPPPAPAPAPSQQRAATGGDWQDWVEWYRQQQTRDDDRDRDADRGHGNGRGNGGGNGKGRGNGG